MVAYSMHAQPSVLKGRTYSKGTSTTMKEKRPNHWHEEI